MKKITIVLLLMPNILLGQGKKIEFTTIKQINVKDTIAKYAYFAEDFKTSNDLKAHSVIWNLKYVRDLSVGLTGIRANIKTFTVTLERPSEKSSYYLIGLYKQQNESLEQLLLFRVNSKNWTVNKKSVWDKKWQSVR